MDKKSEYISKLKQLALADAGVDIDEVERYEKYLSDSGDEDELQDQAQAIAADISTTTKGYVDAYHDKSNETWKPF